jgi:glutamate 5-kinase
MNEANNKYKRIVVKFGTSLLTGGSEHLNQDMVTNLVIQVAGVQKKGLEVVVVSSGAIASGRDRLGLSKSIKGSPFKQVLAAVGQGRLMSLYEQLFNEHEITVAQALLTKTDLSDRAGYLNARNTLMALMELGVICIVNENDVVAMDEIQELKFGDNDSLSAMVANLVDADLLLMLSDTAGLYTADPRSHPEAELISKVEKITPQIEKLATGTTDKLGTGGMIMKIEAAKMATASGVTVIIADGREPDVIQRLVTGEEIGTYFGPQTNRLESRKRWMVSYLSTKSKITIDSGASRAIKKQNSSLLATGIKLVDGQFQRGDVVTISDNNGTVVGCGITNYSSDDIKIIRGEHSKKFSELLGYDYGAEVVHRNNLVVL